MMDCRVDLYPPAVLRHQPQVLFAIGVAQSCSIGDHKEGKLKSSIIYSLLSHKGYLTCNEKEIN